MKAYEMEAYEMRIFEMKIFEMRGVFVETAKRIYLSRIVEKVDKNRAYADRIGIKNKSKLATGKEKIGGRRI